MSALVDRKAQGFPAAACSKVMSLKAAAICMRRRFFPHVHGENFSGG